MERLLSFIDNWIHPQVFETADRRFLVRVRLAIGTLLCTGIPIVGYLTYQLLFYDLNAVGRAATSFQILLIFTFIGVFRYVRNPRPLLKGMIFALIASLYGNILSGDPVGFSSLLWLHSALILTAFMLGTWYTAPLYVLNTVVAYIALKYQIDWSAGVFESYGPFSDVQMVAFMDVALSGLFLLTVGIAFDLIELKAEAEFNESQKELEVKRQALIQASKFQSLGEMAGGIAHEINNPLTIIMAYSETLGRDLKKATITTPAGQPPMDRWVERVERIHRTASRIDRIVRGLLSFARDGRRGEFVKTDLNKVILETLDLCQSKIRNAGITLEIKYFPQATFVIGSPSQLSQVLLNLLKNAVDAIESEDTTSERWIRISCRQTHRENEISVANSGPQIPTEVASRIMEPFFTTKPIGQGTGLGLSISQNIIQMHKGVLTLINSQPTEFIVKLPFHEESDLAKLEV